MTLEENSQGSTELDRVHRLGSHAFLCTTFLCRLLLWSYFAGWGENFNPLAELDGKVTGCSKLILWGPRVSAPKFTAINPEVVQTFHYFTKVVGRQKDQPGATPPLRPTTSKATQMKQQPLVEMRVSKPIYQSLATSSACGIPEWMVPAILTHPPCSFHTSRRTSAEQARNLICKISDGNRLVPACSSPPTRHLQSTPAPLLFCFVFCSCQPRIFMTHHRASSSPLLHIKGTHTVIHAK